jgi:hypothetical protein
MLPPPLHVISLRFEDTMKPRTIVVALAIVLSIAAVALLAQSRGGQWLGKFNHARGNSSSPAKGASPEAGTETRLEGTWRATEDFGGGPEAALYTFSAAATPNSGTALHSDAFYFTAAPSCLSSQGVWQRVKERSFIVTDEGFCFDTFNNFVPAGSLKFKLALQLNSAGTAWDGTATVEGFDADGNLVFGPVPGTMHGERMKAEAP